MSRSAEPAAAATEQAAPKQAERAIGSRHMARILLIALLGVCAAALYSRQGSVEWLLAAVVGTIAFGCLIMPYAALGRVTAVRDMEGTAMLADGGDLLVSLTIRMSRPIPFMWMSVREEIALSGEQRYGIARDSQTGRHAAAGDGGGREGTSLSYHALGLPWFGRSLTIRYAVAGVHRGEWEFRPVTVAVGDMLGMTVRRFRIAAGGQLLVRPAAPAGESFGELPVAAGSGSGEVRRIASAGAVVLPPPAARRRPGADPLSRIYIPGDPPWRIDWRAMARGLGMRTRTGEDEMSGDVVLVLDLSAEAYGSDRRLLDASAGRAALAMRGAFDAGNRITLVCAGSETLRYRIRPGDAAALRSAEQMLARLSADGSGDAAATELANIAALARRGAVIVCFSTARARLLTDAEPGGAVGAGIEGVDAGSGVRNGSAGGADSGSLSSDAKAEDAHSGSESRNGSGSAGVAGPGSGIRDASAGGANSWSGVRDASAGGADSWSGVRDASVVGADSWSGVRDASAGDLDSGRGSRDVSAGDANSWSGFGDARAGSAGAGTGGARSGSGGADADIGIKAAGKAVAGGGAAASLPNAVRLARKRGAALCLLLSCAGQSASPHERDCQKRLAASGCLVSLLPVPEEYRRQPNVGEGGSGIGGASVG